MIGLACLIAFPLWERRTPHPMMPLHIFAARNFAVGNLATVFLYAGVSLGMLIVALFLQETAGLSATAAGLATLPVPVLSFFLARRFGTLAGVHGPRLFMATGPLIAAAGYLLMARVAEPFDFWTQMLPGLVVFGIGLRSPCRRSRRRSWPLSTRRRAESVRRSTMPCPGSRA